MKCSHKPGNDWEAIERQRTEGAERWERAQARAAQLRVTIGGSR